LAGHMSRMRIVMEPVEPRPIAVREGRPFQVVHLVPTAVGRGAQLFARALVDELGGPAKGHRLVCLFDGHSDVAVDDSLGMGCGARSAEGLQLHVIARLFQWLNRSKPDLVVAHGGDAYKYAALCSRAPVVYCAIGTLPSSVREGPRRLFWRALLRRARVVAAVSSEVAVECRAVLGVSASRIVVVPNGRDPARYLPASAADRRQRSGGVTTLLYVGHLSPGKRPEWFLHVVAHLTEAGLPVRGRMVGDGAMMASLRRPASEIGVELLGWREDVVTEYQKSDLLLFPSAPDGEGMPGVLIEAGLCGLPAVATQVAGAPDVIDDGITGRVVPVRDREGFTSAVRELVLNPDRRLEMGAAARAKCDRDFGMHAVATRWDEVIFSATTASARRTVRSGSRRVTTSTGA
jgi:glycosyltransferase involved in cell wall biosynthesis